MYEVQLQAIMCSYYMHHAVARYYDQCMNDQHGTDILFHEKQVTIVAQENNKSIVSMDLYAVSISERR